MDSSIFKPDRGVRVLHKSGTDVTLIPAYLEKIRTDKGMSIEVYTQNHGTFRFELEEVISFYEFNYSVPTTLWKNEKNLVSDT